MNPKVNFYFDKEKRWQKEIVVLRNIVLNCRLTEELKWGSPCYLDNGKNIVLIHTFKDYCAFLFFKGSLLKDHFNLLVQQTKNVQATKQLRFTSLKQIEEQEEMIRSYIIDAIELEKSGAKIEFKKTDEFEIPEEFKEYLKQDKALNTAFYNLTPGRQRNYLLHFSSAKQSKTRIDRIEKSKSLILSGKGLND